MEKIPVVYISNKKVQAALEEKPMSSTTLLSELQSFEIIYVVDKNGLKTNTPNLDIYQILSKRHALWIDAGPQTIGDVVDLVMAGASRLTVPLFSFTKESIAKMRELTERNIYAGLTKKQTSNIPSELISKLDGIVINLGDNVTRNEEKRIAKIKRHHKQPIYLLDRTGGWKGNSADGVLIELKHLQKDLEG